MGLDLLGGIQPDADHDEQRRPAEVEGDVEASDQNRRQYADGGHIQRPGEGDAPENRIDVLGRRLARPDARNIPPLVLDVVGNIDGVEGHSRIEITEEDDQCNINYVVGEMAGAHHGRHRMHPRNINQVGHGRREHDNGAGEDRRDDPGHVHLEGQMAALAAIAAHPHDTFGVVDRHPSMALFHENDGGSDDHHHRTDEDHDHGRHRPGMQQAQRVENRPRHVGDDTGEDDQRDPVADAPLGNLLAEPHDKGGARRQGDHRHQNEADAGVGNHGRTSGSAHGLQPDGDAGTLNNRQDDRAVAGPAGDDLLPLGALFGQALDGFEDHAEQLQNDRGADVGHDPQSKNGHPLQGTAGKGADHPEQCPLASLKKLGQYLGIDTRCRHVTPDAVNRQHSEGEEDPPPQFGNTEDVLDARKQVRSPRLCRRPLQFFRPPTC